MSLFERARDAIHTLQGMLRDADVLKGGHEQSDQVATELSSAHNSRAGLLSGTGGRRVTISSSGTGDYHVEIHDGDRFESYGLQADSDADALIEADKRFAGEDQDKPSAISGPTAVPQEGNPPNDEVDITRGRATNPDTQPAPVLTEAHLGEEQTKAQRQAGVDVPATGSAGGSTTTAVNTSPEMEQGTAVSPDAANAQNLPVQTEDDQNEPGIGAGQNQGRETPTETVAAVNEHNHVGTLGEKLQEAERRADAAKDDDHEGDDDKHAP